MVAPATTPPDRLDTILDHHYPSEDHNVSTVSCPKTIHFLLAVIVVIVDPNLIVGTNVLHETPLVTGTVLIKKNVRPSKYDDQVEEAELMEARNGAELYRDGLNLWCEPANLGNSHDTGKLNCSSRIDLSMITTSCRKLGLSIVLWDCVYNMVIPLHVYHVKSGCSSVFELNRLVHDNYIIVRVSDVETMQEDRFERLLRRRFMNLFIQTLTPGSRSRSSWFRISDTVLNGR
ncbi:hypothetical protein J6590_001884 [Homalodisca vitripennis]|nr:hypothetical protein J6590_001884 [Homalodisca vitripennis]